MTDHRLPPTYSLLPTIHVAVLEDNTELREDILLPALRDHGFNVLGAATAAELYRHMLSHRFDIVLLDIGLPDEDGLTVARHLRGMSDIGIVMLTGRDGRQHHLSALDHGADFYLVKPVDLDVLAATLHSLARRLTLSASQHVVADNAATTNWRLEAGGWRLVTPRGKVIALTASEQCLAATLAAENGQPVSRDSLIRALTGNVFEFDPHRLEMMIHRLRRKVFAQTGETLPLTTVRGNGYLLSCATEEPSPPSA